RPLRAAGLQPRAPGEGAGGQRHQCRPAGDDPRGQLPRGPVLPAQHHRAEHAAAGRAPGRRAAAGRALRRGRQAAVAGGGRGAAAARLAGQRARAAQRDPARAAAGHRPADRAGGPGPAARPGRAPGAGAGAGARADRGGAAARRRGDRAGGRRTGHEPPGPVPAHGAPWTEEFLIRMVRRTLTLHLFLRLLPVLALAAALPWTAAYWIDHGWVLASVSVVVLLGLMWLSLYRALSPLRALFRALSGSVNTYRDGEFNFGVHWSSRDEVGNLVRAHRELGEVLRRQRQDLVQRELLLDTMVQNTP